MSISLDQIYIIAVLAGALGLFAWGRWRYDIVAVMALLAVALPGFVSPSDAFKGFGHPAVITVAAILVITRALRNSGLIDAIADYLIQLTDKPTLQTLSLCGVVAVASAFMNNVGALALMMPVAIQNSHKIGRPVSEVLMPVSFASLLGGLMTLMGTPPNVIISSFRQDALGTSFNIFDYAPVGGVVAFVGVLFIGLFGWRLLPKRETRTSASENIFEIHDYLTEILIKDGSELVGTRLSDLQREADDKIIIAGLSRGGTWTAATHSNHELRAGDALLLRGEAEDLDALISTLDVDVFGNTQEKRKRFEGHNISTLEAIVNSGSVLDGRKTKNVLMVDRFNGYLFAIARMNKRVRGLLSNSRLTVGDVLLFKGNPDALANQLLDLGCFPLARRVLSVGRRQQKWIPVLLLAIAILVSSLGFVAVHIAFIAAALALVLLNFLTPREVYDSIDWSVIVLLGAFFPVGQALKSTGATDLIVGQILALTATMPTVAMIGLLILISMWLSDIINNAAAALIMGPIAVAVAKGLGFGPDPFLMAVAVGCSCTFLTPIGHQSNALVFGPGGYHFGDYWRMGLPLGLIVLTVATFMITMAWPIR